MLSWLSSPVAIFSWIPGTAKSWVDLGSIRLGRI
jgi:hypothetical protein